MRIAFINPPLNDWHFSRSQRSPGVIKSGTMYYPYWLAYATGLAMERGHECLLVDCPADGIDREAAIAKLRDFGPGLVVVETSTPSIAHDLETVELLNMSDNFHVMTDGKISDRIERGSKDYNEGALRTALGG